MRISAGVQTCALPISRSAVQFGMRFGTRMNAGDSLKRPLLSRWPAAFIAAVLIGTTALVLYVEASVSKLKQVLPLAVLRSEERRVGNGCVSTCRYRWSRVH